MPKDDDDDNDTTCTVNALYSEILKGFRQKIEKRMKILALVIFFSLPYTLLRCPPGSNTVSA